MKFTQQDGISHLVRNISLDVLYFKDIYLIKIALLMLKWYVQGDCVYFQ